MRNHLHPFLHWLVREPFVHFIALGALIFIAAHAMGTGAEGRNASISITAQDLERLRAQSRQQWGREPSDAELQGLVQDLVREEVLVREARTQGLDQDDLIVRRRLAQKMEFLANETVEPASEAELRAYHAAHADRYGQAAMLSLEQKLFRSDVRGAQALSAARAALVSGRVPAGDASLLPEVVARADALRLEREFGAAFAQAAMRAPLGQWVGPVESPFGQHLLRVNQLSPAGLAPLDQVRTQVAADWMQQRLVEVRDAHYAALRKKYAVEMPDAVAPAAQDAAHLSVAVAAGVQQ